MTECHICQLPGATIPDPCCSAPDCDSLGDYAHFACLSRYRQAQERRWEEEDEEARWAEGNRSYFCDDYDNIA